MDEIYKLVGQIIEVCQYFEGFFQLVVAMEPFIVDPTFDGETIQGQTIEEWMENHKEEVISNVEESFSETLGNSIKKAAPLLNLLENELIAVQNFLKERNRLVHMYFKETDFLKHHDNPGFIRSQILYLEKRLKKMRNAFNRLKKY